MKQITTISFLIIYLLNLAGNALYIEYLIEKNNQAVTSQIDEGDYESSQLIELKIPLRAPYYSSSVKYERYYGEVNLLGKNYNYVQRKVLNDTIYLLCLPDYVKNRLEKAKTDINSGITDVQPSKGSKKGTEPAAKKAGAQNEYDEYYFSINLSARQATVNVREIKKDEGLAVAFTEGAFKPPILDNDYNI